jgi:hypothetical protein
MRVAARINADSAGDKCLVTVSVHLAGLKENMTINVVVARDADGLKRRQSHEQKISLDSSRATAPLRRVAFS